MANLSIEEILDQAEQICRRLRVEHLYLFGSYATGSPRETLRTAYSVKLMSDEMEEENLKKN